MLKKIIYSVHIDCNTIWERRCNATSLQQRYFVIDRHITRTICTNVGAGLKPAPTKPA